MTPSSDARAESPLPPRKLKPALLAGAAFLLTDMLLLIAIPPQGARIALQVVAIVVANGIAIRNMLSRAAEAPDQSRGWREWSLGIVVGVIGTFGALSALAAPAHARAIASVSLVLAVAGGFLQSQAVLSWPWRRPLSDTLQVNVIGAVIFATSLGIVLWMFGILDNVRFDTNGSGASAAALAIRLGFMNAGVRTLPLCGAVVFLISEEPRRAYEALGVILAGTGTGLLGALGYAHAAGQGTLLAQSAWLSLGLASPLSYAMVAWARQPLEFAPESPDRGRTVTVALQFIPLLVVGIFLAQVNVQNTVELTVSLTIFLVISLLLVYRQLTLFRAVQLANQTLEQRVAERTQRLERVQGLLLRTERLNTLATLGAGITHDLNNMLGRMGMAADLMRLQIATGETVSPEYIEDIMSAIRGAGGLTKRLMLFARGEENSSSPTPVDLCRAVASEESVLRILLPRTIRLELRLEAAGRHVLVPPSLVEQVLINLVTNAGDAMPAGGVVTVSVRSTTDGGREALALEVADTGHGIPEEIQESIFDAFFTTKAEKGTGIGLASVRALMRGVGGDVTVESTPGRGARFRLLFPLNA